MRTTPLYIHIFSGSISNLFLRNPMRKTLSLIAVIVLLLTQTPLSAATPGGTGDTMIDYVRGAHLLLDREDGAFHPEMPVTRVELVESIVRSMYAADHTDNCFAFISPSIPPSYTHLFKDVPRDASYALDVCTAMFVGVTKGHDDNTFRPLEPVTVAEASTMLAKAYGLLYPSLMPTSQPWFGAGMQALKQLDGFDARAIPAATLTRKGMSHMFFALRNEERFPVRNLVGQATNQTEEQTTAVEAEQQISGIEENTSSAIEIEQIFDTTSDIPTDAETIARTHRAPHISRRMLLMKIEAERAQQ